MRRTCLRTCVGHAGWTPCLTMSYHVLHVLPCPTCLTMSYHVLHVLPCPTCLTMSYMSYHVLPCLTMSYHVLHVPVGSPHHRAQSLPCSPRGGGVAAHHSPGTAHHCPYSPRGAPHPAPRRPGRSYCAQIVLLHLFCHRATPAHFVPRSPGLQASRSSVRLSSLPRPRLGSFRRRRKGFLSLEGRRRGRRWRRRWRRRGQRR